MKTHAETHADPIQVNQTKAVANIALENQPTSPCFDNRPEAITQRKLRDNRPETVAQRKLRDNRPETVAQRKLRDNRPETVAQRKMQAVIKNNGLPHQLKTGIESLSGLSMDDVKVHYNSSKPAQLNAHAFAQGNEIHVASGQQKHVPHEAWHVVQQKQGRVKPTRQLQGTAVNDDPGLEREADRMGERALQMKVAEGTALPSGGNSSGTVQLQAESEGTSADLGAVLLGVIGQLERLAVASKAEASRLKEIQAKLDQLKVIATGKDEAMKQEVLIALRKEVVKAKLPVNVNETGGKPGPGVAQKVSNSNPVQRMTNSEMIGLGVAAAGVVVLIAICCLGKSSKSSEPVRSPGDAQYMEDDPYFDQEEIIPPKNTAAVRFDGAEIQGGRSYAQVTATAEMTDPTHRVCYEIKWSKDVPPGGMHLGQDSVAANTWVLDKGPSGEDIGDRNAAVHYYHKYNSEHDRRKHGLYFTFVDFIIQQQELRNGAWWFRIRIVDKSGQELFKSPSVKIDWNYATRK